MKRWAMVITAALLLTGVGASFRLAGGGTVNAAGAKKATEITVWVGWSARELKVFKQIVSEYDRKHPEVTVKVVGGINDDKITAGIRSGKVPDVVSSFTSANVGTYCGSGGWIDLGSLLSKDHINVDMFPATTRYYTQFKGKRCALPFLADVYGLYYNKALFKKAGIKSPPKTMSELTKDAKKLTQRKGSTIKVAGYQPFFGFYAGNAPDMTTYAPLYGAKWTDGQGHSALSKDPQWAKFLRWQKSLTDWYGYGNLVRFKAGAADEFSASHAFEVGKIAMMMDGEWRVAFIHAEHPSLDYGTAPMPVDDAHPELYGSGYVNGTIIGIPKGVKHKDQAWALVKYLTMNSHPLAQFSNGIRNVPTTRASLTSHEIKPDAHFKTFLKIFANAHSATSPITAVGNAYGSLVQSFAVKWQAGHVKNLEAGLKNLDKQIDAQLKQAGPGVP
ncbi:MAG: extracellular solute-binding protein [Gaiellaceae bacterium]|jgi:multiple sugar transport system substrate-binding protein